MSTNRKQSPGATAAPAPLDPVQLELALGQLEGWEPIAGRAIMKNFEFPDFGAAFSFMGEIAWLAERMDHHPDWFNSCGRVAIQLSTHDVHGVTRRDLEMARLIDDTLCRIEN